MMKGKRMILEQGGGWDQTGLARDSKLGGAAETPIEARYDARGEGSFDCAQDDRLVGQRNLVILVARPFPGNKLANRRTSARYWLLVGFHFRARSLFAH